MPINNHSYTLVSQSQSPTTLDELINAKKANIRAYLLIQYDLESDDLKKRKDDLISFMKDIDNTVNNQGDDNALSSVFRGNAKHLASSVPKDVLNTPEQVTDYILEYMPDIIHKSIHGIYPEGRGQAIHGQNSELAVTPLPQEMVTELYEMLGKETGEPFLDNAKLQQLRAVSQVQAGHAPGALENFGPAWLGIPLSAGCCIGSLVTLCIGPHLPSAAVGQAMGTAGVVMFGLGANTLASSLAVSLGANYDFTDERRNTVGLVTAATVTASTGIGYLSGALAFGFYAGVAGATAGCLTPAILGVGSYALNRTPNTRVVDGGVEIQRLQTDSQVMQRG